MLLQRYGKAFVVLQAVILIPLIIFYFKHGSAKHHRKHHLHGQNQVGEENVVQKVESWLNAKSEVKDNFETIPDEENDDDDEDYEDEYEDNPADKDANRQEVNPQAANEDDAATPVSAVAPATKTQQQGTQVNSPGPSAQEATAPTSSEANNTEYLEVKPAVLPPGTQRPNILFLLADDLGFNDISWNNPKVMSPNLSALAKRGLTLHNYYTYHLCNPSRAALMTGYYKSTNHMPGLNTLTPLGLTTELAIMPQFFKKLGYKSHLVGKWHLGFCDKDYLPTRRGFDSFYGFLNGAEDYYTHETRVSHRDVIYDFFENEDVDYTAKGTYSSILFAERSQEIIRKHSKSNSSDPFFLLVSFQSVHEPLQNPPDIPGTFNFMDRSMRKTMHKMILSMDNAVGNIYKTLMEENLQDNTIIVFASDNGALPCGGGNNYPLRGGKSTLWDGGVKVPAFITLPDPMRKRNGDYNALFHVTDWIPTLYEAAGGSPQSDLSSIDGISQLDALQTDQNHPRSEVHVVNKFGKGYIRVGDFKMMVGDHCCGLWVTPEEQMAPHHKGCDYHKSKLEYATARHDNKMLQVFNVKEDPGETKDLSSEHPDITASLLKRYNEIKSGIAEYKAPDHTDNDFLKDKTYAESGWCNAV